MMTTTTMMMRLLIAMIYNLRYTQSVHVQTHMYPFADSDNTR